MTKRWLLTFHDSDMKHARIEPKLGLNRSTRAQCHSQPTSVKKREREREWTQCSIICIRPLQQCTNKTSGTRARICKRIQLAGCRPICYLRTWPHLGCFSGKFILIFDWFQLCFLTMFNISGHSLLAPYWAAGSGSDRQPRS